MHALLDLVNALLGLLSLPFSPRRKGERPSPEEHTHRLLLLIIFGAIAFFGGIIWLANHLPN
jgi:hypothetical protein